MGWLAREDKIEIHQEEDELYVSLGVLTLKMMSFYNGAVLASLTTSLPEAVGE